MVRDCQSQRIIRGVKNLTRRIWNVRGIEKIRIRRTGKVTIGRGRKEKIGRKW